ncbi:MAG: tRNA lysidine(34) synthetase TilS [Gammaproteobacteria bacterium]
MLTAVGARRLVVGFSGGADSTLLLVLARDYAAREGLPLRAVHVDHRLHPDSGAWAAHCAAQARGLGVHFETLTVATAPPAGASIEAWARGERYALLAARLDTDAALLTAHHADDQAETVLQRLLWRAGPWGLAAMRDRRPLGRGWLLRPLLAERRATLRAAATELALVWLEDPGNRELRHPRNRLRATVLPALEASFPDAVTALTEAAALQGEVASLLDELADEVLDACAEPATPPVGALLALPPRLRVCVLRRWLLRQGAPIPGRAQLEALQRELLAARADGQPCVAWQSVAVRRHAGHLFLTRAELPSPAPAQRWAAPWAPLALAGGMLVGAPGGAADLCVARATAGEVWVRHRDGGERLRLHAGGPRRALKTLFQEWGVPTWRRPRWPLLYVDDELAAVPGLAVAAEFRAGADRAALMLDWTPDD